MRTIEEIQADISENNKNQLANRFERSHALITEFLYAVTDEITLDRLEEICNAERDGRLVVLPCKKGDTVYAKTSFFSKNVTEIKALAVRFNGFEYKVTCEGIGDLTFGKTVFLTRESAEQALKGGAK